MHCNYFNLLFNNATLVNKNSKRTETLKNKYHFAEVQFYHHIKFSFPEMFF